MNRDRHIRHGKVALNLLRYDVEWVVRRWGYMGNDALCKYFEYIVSLFKEELEGNKEKDLINKTERSIIAKEDLGEDAKKTKTTKPKKTDTLPVEETETTANVTEPEAAGVKEEESL